MIIRVKVDTYESQRDEQGYLREKDRHELLQLAVEDTPDNRGKLLHVMETLIAPHWRRRTAMMPGDPGIEAHSLLEVGNG